MLVLRSPVGSPTLTPLGDPIIVQRPLTSLVADNGTGVFRYDLLVYFLRERASSDSGDLGGGAEVISGCC